MKYLVQATLLFLLFAGNSYALDLGLEAGTYKLTDKTMVLHTPSGDIEAEADDTQASIAAHAYVNAGKLRLGVGARTGNVDYSADLPQHVADQIAEYATLREAGAAASQDSTLEDADRQAGADAEAMYAKLGTELANQYQGTADALGLSAVAMYQATEKLSFGAEVFANQDTDEVFPSLKAEYASKHGHMTIGTTLNVGEDWAGFGTVVRF